ncbi:uncharacterized protein LOC123556192 [Mercenaria mercenaria]|uniref:uncharacterized protein LOC123556192 n=1 Tax=Mercenaria mercenaria TaxID=6596 RepID=UPI001E1DCF01|nr:uncharacterized protein LOC123556192 [Mercenaria mercenaria]
MEVLDRFMLDQKVESVKEDPVQRQILRILLKYEMQSLLQRLAEIGEESVVVTANVVDGTHSVLSTDQGEKFLHDGVVSHFMDHFVRFLFTGETHSLAGDVAGSSGCCSLKQGICQRENNHSRSSVSSDEPETFMHMKKHQIEQFNRKKDHEDKAIDETVSKLVKNILREGKEKERKNSSTSCSTSLPPLRRKRSFNFHNTFNPSSFNTEGCSEPKKIPIAQFFPTISPGAGRNVKNDESAGLNDTVQENDTRSAETSGDKVITIKIEPNDMEEYGGNVDNENKVEEGSQSKDFVVYIDSDCSNQERTSGNAVLSSRSVKSKGREEIIIVQKNGYHDNSLEESDICEVSQEDKNKEEKNKDSEIVRVRREEEEIALPMVEEFYQNRDKCLEDVKLTAEEKSTNTPITPNISCYKQSRKKSNTFNLMLNGYLYIKDKQSSSGTVYWKCGRPRCKGRVIQRGQELITSQIHIHGPSD